MFCDMQVFYFIGGNGWPGSLGVSTKDGGVNTDLNCLLRISLFHELSVYKLPLLLRAVISKCSCF